MKKFSLLFMFSLVVVVVVSSYCQAEEFKTYISPFHDYKIDFPETWTIRDEGSRLSFLRPPSSKNEAMFAKTEVITVIVYNINDADFMPLEEFKDNISDMRGYKLLEGGEIKIDGNEAPFIVYISDKEKIKTYQVTKSINVYRLTYSALVKNFDKYSLVAEDTIKSFRLK